MTSKHSKRKLTFRQAAHKAVDQIDLCVMQSEDRCNCVPVVEKILRRLVKAITQERRSDA